MSKSARSKKYSFEEFLVEYFNEVKEVDKSVTNYTDWFNTVSAEELVEIASIYGEKEYSRGVRWIEGVEKISINDIPELKSLNR